jgi:hypothetical protein
LITAAIVTPWPLRFLKFTFCMMRCSCRQEEMRSTNGSMVGVALRQKNWLIKTSVLSYI